MCLIVKPILNGVSCFTEALLKLCRYLEQRGTVKASSKRNAMLSEQFDLIEDAFRLFGFSIMVRRKGLITFSHWTGLLCQSL